jgi:hypothetical protein
MAAKSAWRQGRPRKVRAKDAMWRLPVRSPFRMRITTLILLTIIVAMGFTIHVQRAHDDGR